MTNGLRELLKERILVLDGAMGRHVPVAHDWRARECGPGAHMGRGRKSL